MYSHVGYAIGGECQSEAAAQQRLTPDAAPLRFAAQVKRKPLAALANPRR